MSSVIADRAPAHVPSSLVTDFDYRAPPGHEDDVQLAWKRLHEGPDIVWSTRYGGHWIATRAEDIDVMQTDHDRFSYRHVTVPPIPGQPPLAPLEYDPPQHAPLRAVLSPAFGPKPMQQLEGDLRRLTHELLDGIVPRGGCEFVDAFAKRLPIVTFLRLVALPLEDRELLLDLTEKSVRPHSEQDRLAAYSGLRQYTQRWILERRRHAGPDLFSRMVNAQIGGRPINEIELAGMMVNVIFGGLDTVAAALSFTTRCLAEQPGLRAQLREDPAIIPGAIEEFLRRFGIPNTARVVTRDMQYKDVEFHAGEQVLLPKTLHGLDERRYPDPLRIDFNRNIQRHAAFGHGPHRCPGSFLARLELKVFLEEWLKRIPDFRIKPGERPRTESGPVNGVKYLPLQWGRGS
ncbi:MAG TPA: cytochrome P450 [Steroidobacteraceae bacterium]|nr:cytochrome P450 [Steroidobacteraceae bacterium]